MLVIMVQLRHSSAARYKRMHASLMLPEQAQVLTQMLSTQVILLGVSWRWAASTGLLQGARLRAPQLDARRGQSAPCWCQGPCLQQCSGQTLQALLCTSMMPQISQ